MARFTNTKDITTNEFTSKLLESRGDKKAAFYSTPSMGNVKDEDKSLLTIQYYTWKQGDKLYKLANTYYNDASLWWLIGWYNKKPIDTMYSVGDLVEIPSPIQTVLKLHSRVTNLNV